MADEAKPHTGSTSTLRMGIIGAVVTAFCCFTPVLAILLGAVGLGAITGYLDYVLFPALAGFLILIALGYSRMRSRVYTPDT